MASTPDLDAGWPPARERIDCCRYTCPTRRRLCRLSCCRLSSFLSEPYAPFPQPVLAGQNASLIPARAFDVNTTPAPNGGPTFYFRIMRNFFCDDTVKVILDYFFFLLCHLSDAPVTLSDRRGTFTSLPLTTPPDLK